MIRIDLPKLSAVPVLLGCCIVLSAPVVRAQEKSLDQQLLDGLDNELLDGLDDIPDISPSERTDADREDADGGPASADTDDDLPRQFDNPVESKDPLTRIGQRMRAVEDLIARKDTSAQTQSLQKQIVEELALLLQQAKQQRPSASSSRASARSRPSGQPQPEQAGASNRESQKPGKQSTQRLGKSDDVQPEAVDMRAMLKEVWGHLPERVRQQVQNLSSEQFLPKYEKLIEEYYKRLAEERNEYP